MKTEHFNQLSESTQELLVLVAEEASEIIQAVTKILRHGKDSKNPYVANSLTNIQQLEKELGQLRLIVDELIEREFIDELEIHTHMQEKSLEINQWLHHNKF